MSGWCIIINVIEEKIYKGGALFYSLLLLLYKSSPILRLREGGRRRIDEPTFRLQ